MRATTLGQERRRSTRRAGPALFAANGALLPLGYRAVMRTLGVRGSVQLGAALGLVHGVAAAAGAALLAPRAPAARRAGLAIAAWERPAGRDLAARMGVHASYGAVLGGSGRGRV